VSHKNLIVSLACFAISTGILLAGLWPLNFKPQNNVWRLPGNGGLHFEGSKSRSKLHPGGIVFTPDPLVYSPNSKSRKGEISIELFFRPSRTVSNAVPRIVTFYDSANNEKLIIGQWRFFILARKPPPNYKNKRPYREIGARNTTPAGQQNFVTITSGEAGSCIYLNGKLDSQAGNLRLLAENENLSGYRIYLGNSVDIASPWAGDIFGFALYGRALTEVEVLQSYRQWARSSKVSVTDDSGLIARYVFDGDYGLRIPDTAGSSNSLYIPPNLVFSKKILEKANFSRINWSDATLNIAGFIPFGAMFALLLITTLNLPTRRALVLTVLAGAMLSVSIEILQAYLPTRDSSQMDLICNTLGTVLGVGILRVILKFIGPSKRLGPILI